MEQKYSDEIINTLKSVYSGEYDQVEALCALLLQDENRVAVLPTYKIVFDKLYAGNSAEMRAFYNFHNLIRERFFEARKSIPEDKVKESFKTLLEEVTEIKGLIETVE